MFKKIGLLLMISLLALTLAACAETAQPEAAPVNPPATASERQVSEAPTAVEVSVDVSNEASATEASATRSYPIVDTNQGFCYNNSELIDCPAEGEAFYGQDAQFTGLEPSYTDNGDGTVTDNVTGLIWQQSADTDGDGDIDAADKMSYENSITYCQDLSYAGYSDWELPTIKQQLPPSLPKG